MNNSQLVDYTCISPNKTSPRNAKIDTITIHCVVGQLSVFSLGKIFSDPKIKASSNYGIGLDGKIGMYVEEKDRSWCSSNANNDHRAITIEVASEKFHPYKITQEAFEGLIMLLVDVCTRNDIPMLLWHANKALIGKIDEQNMTVHRWFANKECPGDYLFHKHHEIAERVNNVLTSAFRPYTVKVNINYLPIRQNASEDSKLMGYIDDMGVYTIIGQLGNWGKLKSGLGWIDLAHCTRR